MARVSIGIFGEPPPEDNRPGGSLRSADPSQTVFARHIHTFNEPRSPRSKGEQNGIRTQNAGNLTPYEHRHWDAPMPWEEMNRKRGIAPRGEDD